MSIKDTIKDTTVSANNSPQGNVVLKKVSIEELFSTGPKLTPNEGVIAKVKAMFGVITNIDNPTAKAVRAFVKKGEKTSDKITFFTEGESNGSLEDFPNNTWDGKGDYYSLVTNNGVKVACWQNGQDTVYQLNQRIAIV